MKKKILRYPAVDAYYLVSCLIAFTVLYLSLSIVAQVWDFQEDQQKYVFRERYAVDLLHSGEVCKKEEDEELPVTCNAYFSDSMITVSAQDDDSTSLSMESRIWIKDAEIKRYPLLRGRFTKLQEKQEKICVIGKNAAEFFGKDVGDFLVINGEDYRILGILGVKTSDFLASEIFLWRSGLGEKTEQFLQGEAARLLILESNLGNLHEQYTALYTSLSEKTDGWKVYEYKNEKGFEEAIPDERGIYYLVLYAFALLNCISASELWVHERKYEITVKKALGYSNAKIILGQFRQLFALSFAAMAFIFVLQLLCVTWGGSLFGIHLRFSARNLLLILGFTLLTAALGILRPLQSVEKHTIIASFTRGGDGI